ncbi:MAG: bifunctional phosphopantothenoylcysteine decarboxylase/phosphopantothenate--cysteine ligase CoaBC [Actinomycetota bacterium]|nr:bifunctional phosphopantothenoylcysteine decarboxylase/phosphopantothenate--cysteine ligase CoaBC [Actinomycetota bacterium]
MSAPRSPSTNSSLAGRQVLLGVSGGIAAYKAAQLARMLGASGADVSVVMTGSAERFVSADTFATLTTNPVHTSLWERPGEVLHVKLAREADVIVVAPATANLLAKLAHGLADDLLSATLLEATCPVVLAPAMHTGMWEHPATRGNVEALAARGVSFVGPVDGALAHGDQGVGRLAEPDEILAAVGAALRPKDLVGRSILVTAGATHEPIDPVRFIGNRSTGKMGVAVAAEAHARGANVTLILGPSTVPPPPGITAVHVSTAEQMRDAVLNAYPGAAAIVMAAAVADFRPKQVAEGKLKKEHGIPELLLEPTPDILRELGELRGGAILVGFAAETGDLERAGRTKLQGKRVDMVVVNEVGRDGTGFGADTNDAMILAADGRDEPLRTWTKAELAARICDRLVELLSRTPST